MIKVKKICKYFYMILITGLVFWTSSLSAENIHFSSSISEVTVFFDGARIERSASGTIPQGVSTVKLDEISSLTDPKSIRVSVTGQNVRILSVKYEKGHSSDAYAFPEIRALRDTFENFQNYILKLEGRLQVLEYEKAMVMANQNVQRKDGIFIEDLEDVADFFRIRLADISEEQIKLQQKIKNANEKFRPLKHEYKSEIAKAKQRTAGINITLSSPSRTSVIINASYTTSGAGWQPAYNLLADDLSLSTITLSQKANVSQYTGEDWNDVSIKLMSSLQIGESEDLGKVSWVIRTPGDLAKKQDSGSATNLIKENRQVPPFTFTIAETYSIPSDSASYEVMINEHQLNASYVFKLYPKHTSYAFVQASVSGWHQLNLFPGPASLYIEGTYTGEGFINPDLTHDEMTFNMGTDKRVNVNQRPLDIETRSAFLANNIIKTLGYQSIIQNERDHPIKVKLHDYIPISKHEQIDIKLNNSGGATHDRSSGILNWDLNIAAGAEKEISFNFSIKYPEELEIEGL